MADKLRKFRKDSYVEKRFGKDINVSTKEDAPLRKEMTAAETKSVSKAQPSSGASPLSFSAAFAAARKDGDKTFTWKGKSYTTQLASEKKAAPAPVRRSPPASTTRTNTSAPAPKQVEAPSMKGAFEATKSKLSSYGAVPRLLSRDTKGSPPPKVSRPSLEEIANQNKPLTPEQRRKLDAARMRTGMRSSGLAKGGSVRSVDGIAKRGKTRAPMKRK